MATLEAPDQTSAPKQQGENSNPPEYKPNWKVIVPVVLISAVILLVCLPVCALLIVNSTGCCLANGPEKMITFWASMIAGFLALFGMLVTGVFVITSLRVEATARAQAQSEARTTASEVSRATARQAVEKFIRRRKGEMFEDLERASDDAAQVAAQAEELAREAEKSKGELEELKGEITTLQNETINVRTVIDGAHQDVERRRGEAIAAIDSAQQGVETAARAARDRIDRAGEPPQGGGESR